MRRLLHLLPEIFGGIVGGALLGTILGVTLLVGAKIILNLTQIASIPVFGGWTLDEIVGRFALILSMTYGAFWGFHRAWKGFASQQNDD